MTWRSPRLELLAERDLTSVTLVTRLLDIAQQVLPSTYIDGEFVFTMNGILESSGAWQVRAAGTSLRYGAITALGLLRLPESAQMSVLAGETSHDLITRLVERLGDSSNIGDVALICWAAAEDEHAKLPYALERLAELEDRCASSFVIEAAWVLSALVAARPHVDVEELMVRARTRLIAARPGQFFQHAIGHGMTSFRAHVGSFADQVYSIQALARLHRSADDPQALTIAENVASAICAAQGEAGQWWWHYDARVGGVVEGYPVYSVHQHAMAPMALFDLSEAGGTDYSDAICRGLHWLDNPPETSEVLVLDSPPITWRKVARHDPRKLIRGLRAASTRVAPGVRFKALDRVFRPGVVDHECRPYELGWLLMTWLSLSSEVQWSQ
jgi:hypothetical protein